MVKIIKTAKQSLFPPFPPHLPQKIETYRLIICSQNWGILVRLHKRIDCFLLKQWCWNQSIRYILTQLSKLLYLSRQIVIFLEGMRKLQIIQLRSPLWEYKSFIRKIIHLIDSWYIILSLHRRIDIDWAIYYYPYLTESMFPTNRTGNLVEVCEIWVAAIKLYYFS